LDNNYVFINYWFTSFYRANLSYDRSLVYSFVYIHADSGLDIPYITSGMNSKKFEKTLILAYNKNTISTIFLKGLVLSEEIISLIGRLILLCMILYSALRVASWFRNSVAASLLRLFLVLIALALNYVLLTQASEGYASNIAAISSFVLCVIELGELTYKTRK
jgi:hypothetical protein